MRYRNLFWGVILILTGVLFTLENLNLIYFNVRELWRLWPVVLVLWGISILPADKWMRLGLVLLVLGGSVFYMLDQTVVWEQDRNFNVEWPESENNTFYQSFDISNEDTVQLATLDMEAAAGSFLLNDTTMALLHFSQNETGISYTYSKKQTGDRVEIKIKPEGSRVLLNKKSHSKVEVRLNESPLWDIKLEVGAAALQFDLSPFRVKNLDLESGAASLKLKLGDKFPETRVNIDAGASELVLRIPESSGCDLEISTVLSVKSIKGFEKVDHGHYRTANFNSAANKIYVEVNAAMSNYTIIRY
ncbi:MAG: DUF5668 domain-containing protein [Bacteroidales bacterium]|nr:DUF5668 domain-containing protein [Bacteroidales bacterium]